MKPDLRRHGGYTLIELVVSIGLLVGVISSFSVALNGIHEIEERCVLENRGIVVLNNVLTRLEAGGIHDKDSVERILNAELEASSLSGKRGISARCTTTTDRIHLQLLRGTHPLAGMEVPQ